MEYRFLSKVLAYNKDAQVDKLVDAYDFALDISKKNNEDQAFYVACLDILIPLKPDDDTIITCLIYNLFVKDYIKSEEVSRRFGGPVLQLLFGIKKVLALKSNRINLSNEQKEVFIKLVLVMAKDLRVVLILLARRLNFLQNPEKLAGELKSFANDSLEIYVPIAERLGIYKFKTDLEDLSFKYIDPQAYEFLERIIKKFHKIKKRDLNDVQIKLEDFLKRNNVKAKINGRIKSVYSSYKKIERKHYDTVEKIYDMMAIRVILSDVFVNSEENFDHLYNVLGLIHSHWQPVTKRFKDYVVVPKTNGYRSLHTVILGLAEDPEQPVEVQIRTESMHANAEYGIASHWFYKQYDEKGRKISEYVDWIKNMERFYDQIINSDTMVKKFDVDLFKDRIFVLTPRGDVIDLPLNSTPIDFAYRIHTDIGNHCVMAKIDGNVVPLNYKLRNGQSVEIIVNKNSTPKLQWFSIVTTGFAKRNIKAWFNKLNKENNLKTGKEILNKILIEKGYSLMDNNYSLLKNYDGKKLSLPLREQLIGNIGRGVCSPRDVIRKIFPAFRQHHKPEKIDDKFLENSRVEENVIIGGHKDLPYRFAKCCNPTTDDLLLGYVTRSKIISIHSTKCPLIDALDTERIVMSFWQKSVNKIKEHYPLRLKINADIIGRMGLIKDLTGMIEDLGFLLVDLVVKKNESGISNKSFVLELAMERQKDVNDLLKKINTVEGVLRIKIL